MEPIQGLLVADKYRLERMLAQGGMGSVWAAVHVKLDSRVAVKFMSAALAVSADMHTRFEREAKAAALLRSPHVVQVLDYGIERGTPYIVMELLEGEDLRARLRREAPLPLRGASDILSQACKALRLAAGAGLVHRDLKPANIFLTKSGDDEVVKILDFGVAKAVRSELDEHTAAGLVLGSPHYMSPEQARGMPLDHRSDLFSMGVILFQMIVGRRPFPGREAGDVIVRICADPLPRVSQLLPGLPPELDEFFERALAREPGQRFQSARDMSDAFAAIVSDHLGEELARMSIPGGAQSSDDPSWPSGRAIVELTPMSLRSGSLHPREAGSLSGSRLAGTLTLATGSVEASTPRRSSRSLLILGAMVLIIAFVVWWELRPTEPVASAASDATAPSTQDPAPSSTATEDDVTRAPEVSPSATEVTSQAPSATPSSEASAPRKAPRTRPRSKPASPAPAPSANKHPVLGI